jgi:hypothetical protein
LNVTAEWQYKTNLLTYRPCLQIGDPLPNETKGIDAQILLQRLQDPFGDNIMRGVTLTDGLITRKEFFTLLARSQCVPMLRDADELTAAASRTAEKLKFDLPFIDLPLDPRNGNSLLLYSLLAAGTDVSRSTLIGAAADLSSPITRGEALKAVDTVLGVPASKRSTDGVLPNDLSADDPLAPLFLVLQNLDVLPSSFTPVFGSSQGLNGDETAILIDRAAFVGGKDFNIFKYLNRVCGGNINAVEVLLLPSSVCAVKK